MNVTLTALTPALALCLLPVAVPPATAAVRATYYDSQPLRSTALFSVKATNNAAAQEFTTALRRVSRVSVYVASQAATGQITVQIRRNRTDSGSALASRTLSLASVGGAGAGWLEFPVNADVTPGTTYYLHLQATTTENKPIAWYGTVSSVPNSLTSWNYDRSYWGGWHPYTTHRLAFHVEPTGSERCGEADQCYVPATWLAQRTSGLLTNLTTTEAVPPAFAVGASYVGAGNVLKLPSGRWRYLPAGATKSSVVAANTSGALAQVAESERWLAAGTVPGRTETERAASRRALLSARALLRPNGALAAAWSPAWQYSWPRDGAFAVAAFAATGHDSEAYRVLQFDADTQRADGTWEARTKLDGSGPPDQRPWQLDANGWVPWATWQWYQAAPAGGRDARLRALYPMVRRAADYAVRSLGADGLPPASPDYWELPTPTTNIGTAAPLLAGLNASADLALSLGEAADSARWAAAARRLSAGIARSFAPTGYPRTADGRRGRDSAAAFMAPPFNTAPRDLPPALASTYQALLLPNGGVSPGNDPQSNWGSYAWTASTSFFALAWAHLGDQARSDAVLRWVLSKRNGLGEFPETVNGAGHPSSVAPLVWTGSLAIMTLRALQGTPLPTPPSAVVAAGAAGDPHTDGDAQ
ncbi:hypothetical protein LG634_21615 [Streptomyces bambusae]|uniref:hypothetical protein n=1 Tax=Streptomyces bambusae TaxID=1550616 RepID=UPI001CFD632A|nr:hypothetical protein [Streptomyces bambusae]MCB5167417.1 hypothetical protein [Streptomyces bambusae]